jgi:hypothetical protein
MPAQQRVWFDDMQRIFPPTYLMSQEHQYPTIVRRLLYTSLFLTVEHDHLLPQKSILRDQVLSAAEEIAHYPLDGAIRRGLSPGFYSPFDRFKTTHQPLFTFVPEVSQMHP